MGWGMSTAERTRCDTDWLLPNFARSPNMIPWWRPMPSRWFRNWPWKSRSAKRKLKSWPQNLRNSKKKTQSSFVFAMSGCQAHLFCLSGLLWNRSCLAEAHVVCEGFLQDHEWSSDRCDCDCHCHFMGQKEHGDPLLSLLSWMPRWRCQCFSLASLGWESANFTGLRYIWFSGAFMFSVRGMDTMQASTWMQTYEHACKYVLQQNSFAYVDTLFGLTCLHAHVHMYKSTVLMYIFCNIAVYVFHKKQWRIDNFRIIMPDRSRLFPTVSDCFRLFQFLWKASLTSGTLIQQKSRHSTLFLATLLHAGCSKWCKLTLKRDIP